MSKAGNALREALENNAADDEIATRLSALRDARAAAREELTTARRELQEVVTGRQEAVLVVNGILE